MFAYITPEEYLEIDRKAELKSEYYQGETWSLGEPPVTRGDAHSQLVWNLIALLGLQIRAKECHGYASDIKIKLSPDLYASPGVIVVGGNPRFLDERRDTLLNPTLIREVPSPSNEFYDRGRKFEYYRALDSFREYLLVSSDQIHVERYTRQFGGDWLLRSAGTPDDTLDLESIDCRITLADLCDKVNFT